LTSRIRRPTPTSWRSRWAGPFPPDVTPLPESLDPWPNGALDPSIYRSAIEQRWKAAIGAELRGLWWGKFVGWFGGLVSEDQAADFAIQKMDEALKEWGLAH